MSENRASEKSKKADALWAKLMKASREGKWAEWERIADEIERLTGRDPR